jgi:hypothetical protein
MKKADILLMNIRLFYVQDRQVINGMNRGLVDTVLVIQFDVKL